MRYVGSKNRISKYLVPIIQSYIDKGCNGYIEPFVGGANIIDKINCNKKYGFDTHKYLISLLKQARDDSTVFPDTISEDIYKDVKNNKDKYEDWFVGLVGFCATFGSKYFGGYARGFKEDKITLRDMPNEGIRNLTKQSPNFKYIYFDCRDFRTISSDKVKDYVIYCDPPYRNTTKYSTSDFPYDEFYQWCRDLSKNNIVLISEYSMPNDFECIWEKETTTQLNSKRNANDKANNRVEKLFIYKGGK